MRSGLEEDASKIRPRQPSKEVGGDEKIINSLSSNINAIGYIDTSSVDSRVKVLLAIN